MNQNILQHVILSLLIINIVYLLLFAALFTMCSLMCRSLALFSITFSPSTQTVIPHSFSCSCGMQCSSAFLVRFFLSLLRVRVHMHSRYQHRLNQLCGKMLQIPCFYFWGPIHLVCHVHQLTNDVSLHKVDVVCFQCLTLRSRNYFDWRFHSSLSFLTRNSPKWYIESQVSPWRIHSSRLTDSLPHSQIMLIISTHPYYVFKTRSG